jgi:hypothetical protein
MIDRGAFDSFREEYWMKRAQEIEETMKEAEALGRR